MKKLSEIESRGQRKTAGELEDEAIDPSAQSMQLSLTSITGGP